MPIKLENFGQAIENDIKILGEIFDVNISTDYKEFLMKTNGGRNAGYKYLNQIEISEISEVINIDVMFGIHTNVKNADIEQWTRDYEDDIFPNSLIIGDTMQHGFIFYWLSGDENEGIYYYDDTYEFESSSDESNAYYLAKSFSDFEAMVQN